MKFCLVFPGFLRLQVLSRLAINETTRSYQFVGNNHVSLVGKRKVCLTIKNSQNIMNMIVYYVDLLKFTFSVTIQNNAFYEKTFLQENTTSSFQKFSS